MIRTCTDAWAGVLFNVFLKHVVSQKFLHNGFRILQYETRTLNDDFWLFSNQGLVRSMTNSFSKSSSLNKRKRFQSINSFSNKLLEHFFKIVQKISQNLLKLVLKKTPSKPLSNFIYAIIKGEYKKKKCSKFMQNLSFSPKAFS